jgi:hypothetical protein
MAKRRLSDEQLVAQRKADDEFWRAVVIMRDESSTPDAVEFAAALAVEFARERGDRGAWCCVLAGFNEFVERGQAPPAALLRGLAQVFRTYMEDPEGPDKPDKARMDRAFNLVAEGSPGYRDTWGSRAWENTNADAFARYLHRGASFDEAGNAVAELQNGSVSSSSATRHYYSRYVGVKSKDRP